MGDPLRTSVAAFQRRHGAGACDCRCRGDEGDSEDCCSHAADLGEEEGFEEEGGEEGQEEEGRKEAEEEEKEEEEGEEEKEEEEGEEEEGALRRRQAREGPAQEQGCD